jgi:hypothetical protein
MPRYEYKVIPAPRRGEKSRDARTSEDRFALALTTLMNQMGRDGWEYQRADTLPCDERSGLTGTKTTYQNVLVFRRIADDAPAPVAVTVPEATPTAPAPRLGPATEPPLGSAPPVGPAE